MIRQGRHKLISHGVDDQRPQLFDLQEDPGEETDLGFQPSEEHQATIAHLRGELAKVWDPAACDRRAKLATEHMRRLWRFEKDHEELASGGWQGDFNEKRVEFRP